MSLAAGDGVSLAGMSLPEKSLAGRSLAEKSLAGRSLAGGGLADAGGAAPFAPRSAGGT